MKITMDEQGRVEIPRECRERMNLTGGAILDFQAIEGTLQFKPVLQESEWVARDFELVREGSVLVISTPGRVTNDDVNRVIEMIRQERIERNMGLDATGS
jgi:bifunctional DNA-binding transcriptional regulator/antitoxin component of YhaV-PrlF toxin-antitoxin module